MNEEVLGTPKVARGKYWTELDTEQKVERMRQIVKNVTERTDVVTEAMHRIKELLASHRHDGDTVIEVKTVEKWLNYGETAVYPRGALVNKTENKNEVYF